MRSEVRRPHGGGDDDGAHLDVANTGRDAGAANFVGTGVSRQDCVILIEGGRVDGAGEDHHGLGHVIDRVVVDDHSGVACGIGAGDGKCLGPTVAV